jgi:glycolate oxidase iron-sulfur subunit
MSAPPPRPAPNASWFDAEDAPGRIDLRTCIHCGLCLTACPTYRELRIEPDSPRGRLYLMRGLAEGRVAADDDLVQHLDQCLDCRACETVCPAGVPYSRLLEETRGQLARRRPRRSPLRVLGTWVLERVMPERERLHLAVDLMRLGQRPPLGPLVRRALARGWLPDFARRGWDMTPELLPRRERALERIEPRLPHGARMERHGDALVFHPAGAPRMRVGFFTSCVMDTMFPAINHEAVRLMVLAGIRVEVPIAQSCCGALQAHAGLRRTARRLARRNVRAFEPGLDAIVSDSAGCGAALREGGHLLHEDADAERAAAFSSRVRDISEVLATAGLPAATRPLASATDPSKPLRIGYHDPCHLAHAQKVRNEPRRLLRAIPGVELVDLPNSDWCCGSAGVYNLVQPEMAEAQLVQKLASVEVVAPELVVASNPGCLLHMARGARERGMRARMVHLLEVLAMAYPADDAAAPAHDAATTAHAAPTAP